MLGIIDAQIQTDPKRHPLAPRFVAESHQETALIDNLTV
jgi:hypothetical protein